MNHWLRSLSVAAAGLVVLVLVVLGIGWMLPVDHTATVSRVVAGPPEAVWSVMTRPEDFPAWRPGVDGVEVLPDPGGLPVWRESAATGSMTLEVTEMHPPTRLVTRIADEGLPFGGTWTYELEEEGAGTRVTITEDGEVYSPFFRFVSRFIIGYEGTMRAYLEGLEERMGEGAAEGTP